MAGPGPGSDLDALRRLMTTLRPGERRLTVMTGAGVSTESGVPDFRSPGSPWRRYPPIGFQDFLSDPCLRAEAWRRKFAMDDLYAGARPGRSHEALVALSARGVMHSVITQNIDGLHQAAGLDPDRLVELHGNGTFAQCLDCRHRFELAPLRKRFQASGEAPLCGCGGLVKSATVAFGQSVDTAVLTAAIDAARSCDVVLVVGSSLVVRPAAQLPALAKDAGAALAIVNREPTLLDGLADVALQADAGDVLSALACWH